MKKEETTVNYRQAEPTDAGLILELLHELAEFEGVVDNFRITQDTMKRWLETRALEGVIAFCGDEAAGLATFYTTCSTFRGKTGLYIEDLYVRDAFRHRGMGSNLMDMIMLIASERDACRVSWQCLDWNTTGLDFYMGRGAKLVEEWLTLEMPVNSVKP